MISLMGIGFLIFVIILVLMLILLLTNPLKKYEFICLNKMHYKVSGILFWNFWLRFLIEENLSACICICC